MWKIHQTPYFRLFLRKCKQVCFGTESSILWKESRARGQKCFYFQAWDRSKNSQSVNSKVLQCLQSSKKYGDGYLRSMVWQISQSGWIKRDGSCVKPSDKKSREQRVAAGRAGSNIPLACNTCREASCCMGPLCGLSLLRSSLTGWKRGCWSGTWRITGTWFEMSTQSGQGLLMKGRECWILLSLGQGQNNLFPFDWVVEVKIFGKKEVAFLKDARWCGQDSDNSLHLKPARNA